MMQSIENDAGWVSNPGRRWHNRYPDLSCDPIPIAAYASEERFQLEKDRVFRKVWLKVGREEQIPRVGSHFTMDIPLFDTSVLVTRDANNRIRAFHNMCSHRGSKVVVASRGCSRRLTCPYHNWTYDLDGRLISIPGEKAFFNLDKAALGLTPIRVDVWAGFIFINFDDAGTQGLAEYLGEIGERMAKFNFSAFSQHYSYVIDLTANWKIFLDAFQEVYHVPAYHKETLTTIFTGSANPLCHVVDVQAFAKHRTITMYSNPSYAPAGTVLALVAARSPSALPPGKRMKDAPGVNPAKSDSWGSELNGIFPHTFINFIEGAYFTLTMWPLTVDRTRFMVDCYYPVPLNASQRFCQEYANYAGFADTLGQDVELCEQTQKVIRSGAKKFYQLQDEEIAIRHTNKVIDDMIGGTSGASSK